TGPVSLAGNISLANAEILGVNVLCQLVSPGLPIIYGFAATTSDLRSMGVCNASPGFLKQARYGALLAKRYGLACRSGGG
ncbi:MAG: trimethylamine methyltransferase family protein, partial [Clostridia bacterium]|nr:trimethylamine methyltransferase family protein [Clostridia bacterium]